MTSKIDEEIFKPLYTTEKGDNRVGRPNVPIRILVAMIILKEGVGCSDEQLYEYCRFNLLYRRALGMVSLDELCPTIDSYYGFRRKLCKHEEMFKENLFDKCFKQITKQQALAFFVEDAAKTVFRTDSETMGKRLLTLGIVIDYILTHTVSGAKYLLERVFSEQYEKSDDGVVSVRDKRKISAKRVQNPNDPDAEYRGKNKKRVKGFVTNITETLPEDGKPSLITDVKVKGVTVADNDFFEETEKVTGDDVENAKLSPYRLKNGRNATT